MRSGRGATTLVVAGALMLAFSACGGGPSDDDFRSDATKICQTAIDRAHSAKDPAGLNPSSRAFADNAAELSADVESLRSELSGLDVPSDLLDAYGDYTGSLAEQQRAWDELSELTQTPERIRGNLRMLRLSKAPRAAGDLGLDACADAARALGAGQSAG